MNIERKFEIGYSKNPSRRIKEIDGNAGDSDSVWYQRTDDMYNTKKKLKEHFDLKQIQGDWFQISLEDVISSLAKNMPSANSL